MTDASWCSATSIRSASPGAACGSTRARRAPRSARSRAGSGLDVVAAAAGIHRVINARMADQIRLVDDQARLRSAAVRPGGARRRRARARRAARRGDGHGRGIVPEAPGVLAAFGLLAAAIEHHHARTLPARADVARSRRGEPCLAELDAAGRARMAEEGVPAAEVRRGLRRGHALRRPGLRAGGAGRGAARRRADADVVAAFHAAHERVYGYARAAAAGGVRELPRRAHLPAAAAGGDARPRARGRHAGERSIGERRAYFARASCHGDLRARAAAARARACRGRPSWSRPTRPP